MSTKQRIIGTVLAGLFLVTPIQAQSSNHNGAGKPTAASDQEAAPILHRRTSLPSGWFTSGKSSGALTDTKVVSANNSNKSAANPKVAVAKVSDARTSDATASDARPVAHFDTLGPTNGTAKGSATGPANRLRKIRETVVLEQTPSGPSADRAPPKFKAPPSGPPSRKPPVRTAQSSSAMESNSAASSSSQPPAKAVRQREETDTTGALPGIDQLPSVMKRPEANPKTETAAAAPANDRMKLTVGEPQSADRHQESLTPHDRTSIVTVEGAESSIDVSGENGVLIENEGPQLSVVTRGPKSMVVGKAAAFTIDLRNHGEVPADEVTVRMNIPQWVEIADQEATMGTANVQPDDSGNAVLSWRIDHLAGRGQEQLELSLVPRGNRPLDLGVTWTFSPARSMTQIQVQEPKLALTVVGPQDVLYGETKVYTITVSNPGTGDAENVVLNLLPLVPGEKTSGTRSLGTIPAGGRQTMEVELTARQTGRLEVRAEVTGDGSLLARGQQPVLVRRAALDVQVQGPPMKYAGTPARYSVRVANTGDAPASDVVVLANLPAGAKEVSSTDGGSFDSNTGQIQWRAGTLRPGASRIYELECMLMSPGDNRVDLRSIAMGDLTALGSAVTHVESLADLKMTVNDPQGAVAVGADVAYEVRITNRGTKAAENVQVFGYFSDGIEPTGVAGWKGRLGEGEVVLQTIPRIGAGQEMLLRISARASRSGDHVFRAELECKEPETKLAVEEWTRFYGEYSPTRQADRRRPAAGQPAPPQPLQGAR